VAKVDWNPHGDEVAERGPFDLVLAADVLYAPANPCPSAVSVYRTRSL
jgi:hypothetical protein